MPVSGVAAVLAADMPSAAGKLAAVGRANGPADLKIRVVVVKACVLGQQPDAHHIAEAVVEGADGAADRFRCHLVFRLPWLCGARRSGRVIAMPLRAPHCETRPWPVRCTCRR